MNKENKMYDYLLNHNYISKKKKSNYQSELSIERAECIANKFNSLAKDENTNLKQALIDIREYIVKLSENSANSVCYLEGMYEIDCDVKKDILEIIEKVLGDEK